MGEGTTSDCAGLIGGAGGGPAGGAGGAGGSRAAAGTGTASSASCSRTSSIAGPSGGAGPPLPILQERGKMLSVILDTKGEEHDDRFSTSEEEDVDV